MIYLPSTKWVEGWPRAAYGMEGIGDGRGAAYLSRLWPMKENEGVNGRDSSASFV